MNANEFCLIFQEYDSDEASPTSYAEVERFQGKVVYNLDGKAYIIDADNELSLQLSDSSIKGEFRIEIFESILVFRIS